MQEHLLTRDSAIAYLLDNVGIKNIAGIACENVYATFGRSGYRPDNACPGKLVQKILWTLPHQTMPDILDGMSVNF